MRCCPLPYCRFALGWCNAEGKYKARRVLKYSRLLYQSIQRESVVDVGEIMTVQSEYIIERGR